MDSIPLAVEQLNKSYGGGRTSTVAHRGIIACCRTDSWFLQRRLFTMLPKPGALPDAASATDETARLVFESSMPALQDIVGPEIGSSEWLASVLIQGGRS